MSLAIRRRPIFAMIVGISILQLPLAALAQDETNPKLDEPVDMEMGTAVDNGNTGFTFGLHGSGTAAVVPTPDPSAVPVPNPATGGQGGLAVGLRRYRFRLDPPHP